MSQSSTPAGESQGISRRDLLKKGAALGGTVVWVTPVVQTLGMGRAFASTVSPAVDISYIVLNIVCDGEPYHVKWEFDDNAWVEGGAVPGCHYFVEEGKKIEGDQLGLGPLKLESASGGCFQIKISAPCSDFDILNGVAKTGSDTCYDVNTYGVFCTSE